jgi:hypothetical protein
MENINFIHRFENPWQYAGTNIAVKTIFFTQTTTFAFVKNVSTSVNVFYISNGRYIDCLLTYATSVVKIVVD